MNNFNTNKESICKIIYYNLITFNNFIITIQLLGILCVYNIIKHLKKKNYIFLIDDFTIYYINLICLLLLIIRFIYTFYTIKKIKNSFNKIQTNLINLFTIVTISHTNYYNDIDDIDDIVVHSPKSYSDNNNILPINEFKSIILFYISYFIYILLNNPSNLKFIYLYNNLLDTRIYENYLFNKLTYNFYQINHNFTKLHLFNIYIKSLLHNNYHDNFISSIDYTKCNNIIDNLSKNMFNIYLFINTKENRIFNRSNNITEKIYNLLDNYNFQFYIIIKILSNILIIISILLLINYYINYLSDISLIYISIISFIYLFLNTYIDNILYNCINFDYKNYYNYINVYDYILNIQTEINLIYLFSINKINVIYK
jgi:hypothetical protein